ncbi:MAG: hypothetical protein JXA99_07675 [Candidatus Lokiarchaeota archaeon]|nr:hypothetical protein [Candidatus Lokiarchaeota archaeon]
MISIIGLFLLIIPLYIIPIPSFTIEKGKNLAVIMSFPEIWLIGFFAFLADLIVVLYIINQPPILQLINLPEAQGIISSINQFLELTGAGIGPIIVGLILTQLNQNYQFTVFIIIFIGIIGCFFWLFGIKSIDNDIKRINTILAERAIELKKCNLNIKKCDINGKK